MRGERERDREIGRKGGRGRGEGEKEGGRGESEGERGREREGGREEEGRERERERKRGREKYTEKQRGIARLSLLRSHPIPAVRRSFGQQVEQMFLVSSLLET